MFNLPYRRGSIHLQSAMQEGFYTFSICHAGGVLYILNLPCRRGSIHFKSARQGGSIHF